MTQQLRPILEVGKGLGLLESEIISYGPYKAKVSLDALNRLRDRPDGKLVVVTAITPTRAGEGKTTSAISLTQGLGRIGVNVALCLRQPSTGPLFGIKGGGTGGGKAQVVPMEEINLHFNGDIHAVEAAHNLLAAVIDAAIFHGQLQAGPSFITWPRTLDVNDRALRHIVTGLGGVEHGVPMESSFVIAAASELMAILALARDLPDLRARIARIIVTQRKDGSFVTTEDLRVAGAMTVLMKEALLPNLVQTMEGQPALIHAGPFGNIAHGNNSLLADQIALKLADIVVTEAGFGADLGAEKYMDIKARIADVAPSAVVVVATVRALKMHGGVPKDRLTQPDLEALQAGVANLRRHVHNVEKFGVTPVVAINRFSSDTAEELDWLLEWCAAEGVQAAVADVWGRGGGGDGGDELAAKVAAAVAAAVAAPNSFHHLYPLELPVEEKIRTIAQEIYGADGVDFSVPALKRLADIEKNGWSGLPVCMAKTQYSFTDDASRFGAPKGFTIHVRDLIPKTGAGFIVALTGAVMTMPGLPAAPAAMRMDVDDAGNPVGLS